MVQPPVEVLDQTSLGRIVDLHERIYASLPDPSFLYHRDAAFFARLMVEGAILGLSDAAGELIGYGAVVAPGVRFPDCPDGFEQLGIDVSRIAFNAGGGVHPDHRRGGLMKRLFEARDLHAASLGADFITGVVAPGNGASLAAVHGLGYAAMGVHRDGDGDNYLLLKPTLTRFPAPAAPVREVGLADCAAHFALLRDRRLVGLPLGRGDTARFAYVEAARLAALPL